MTKPLLLQGDHLEVNFSTSAGGSLRVEVQANPALAATDCVLETAHGTVCAGLTSQIETLKRALVSTCERRE